MIGTFSRATTVLVLVAGLALIRSQLEVEAQSIPTPVFSAPAEEYPVQLKAALTVPPGALKRGASRNDQANRATLDPVDAAFVAGPSEKPGVQQIGFAREIPAARRFAPSALRWTAVSGGQVAVFSVRSPGAVALRLGIRVQSLPSAAELRFFGTDDDQRVLGPERLADLRQATVSEQPGGQGTYWSPVVGGDTAGVEIFVPTSGDSSLVVLSVPLISHLVKAPWSGEKASALCEIDIACYDATWGSIARAVARMVFSSGGSSFLCTGTLLNDTDSSTFIPYFLTANHCIDTAQEAASLNTFWMYQYTSCGGSTPASGSQLTSGAVVLSTSTTNDHTLLRLNSPAPASAVFAGWTTATPSSNTAITGIHHPAGDFKKISFGVIEGVSSYGGSATGSGDYLRVHWNAGVTEGGSSGSALFISTQQLVGQLKGGSSFCTSPTDPDWYGRFSSTYSSVAPYLNPTVSQTRIIGISGNLAFGNVPVGSLSQRTMTISNSGNSSLSVSSIAYPPGFGGNVSSGAIPAGGSMVVNVTFSPVSPIVYGGTITVFANQTAGTNTISASGTGKPVAGDINGDGMSDLIWRNPTTGANLIWYLNGANVIGQQSLPSVADPAWQLVATGDLNRDGYLDAIWRNVTTGANVVWYLNGSAYLGQESLPPVANRSWVIGAVSDINQDGWPDLIWRNIASGSNVIWYLNGTSLASQANLPSVSEQSWQMAASADMNQDGFPDLIWRNAADGANVVWYLNNGSYVATANLPAVADPAWRLMAALDLNRDQLPDLIWRNTATGANAVWYMNGVTYLGQDALPSVPEPTWRIMGVYLPDVPSDINGDRHPDLIWRNTATGANLVWYTNGVAYLGQTALPSVPDLTWRLEARADVNGDQHPDLIWRNGATGANVVWFLNGTSYMGSASLPSVPDTNWHIVAAADLDADTHPDLIWRNSLTGANIVWFLNGTTYLGQVSLLPPVPDVAWRIVDAADMDGDTYPDLIWRNTTTGANVVRYLKGTSFLSQVSLPSVPDTTWQLVAVLDEDGDGNPDLLWRNQTTGVNVVWYMSGTAYLSQADLPTVSDLNWTLRAP